MNKKVSNPGISKQYIPLIFLSMIGGSLIFISPALLFSLVLTVILLYVLFKKTPAEDRNYILFIMVVALIVRLAALILVQYYCFAKGAYDFFGDGEDNIARGLYLADYLKGVIAENKMNIQELFQYSYNVHGKTFFNGIFFGIFGNDVFILKYLNLLCIAISGWLIYDLTRRIYSGLSGRIAIGVILFFPTLFVWSISDLKESHIILFITNLLWGMNKLVFSKTSFRKRLVYLLLIVISSIYLSFLRIRAMPPIIVSSFLLFFTYLLCRKYIRSKFYSTIQAFILFIILGLILFIFKDKIYQHAINCYSAFLAANRGFLSSGGINYDLIKGSTDVYNPYFIFQYMLASLFHFLLEPFPHRVNSLGTLFLLTTLFFWYSILFFSISGIIKIIKLGYFDKVSFAFIFMAVFVLSFSMSVSNIGTAVRIRDNILPILAMFASCGFVSMERAGKK